MRFDTTTRLHLLAPTLAVVLFGAGCFSAAFTPSGDVPVRQPKKPAEIKIYFDDDEPRCNYRVVGHFSGRFGLETIPEGAAERGFDGIVGMACATPGTVGADWGECAGKAYVCE